MLVNVLRYIWWTPSGKLSPQPSLRDLSSNRTLGQLRAQSCSWNLSSDCKVTPSPLRDPHVLLRVLTIG
jgi:hypothetical protein